MDGRTERPRVIVASKGAPESLRFVDLFAGLGGFHVALRDLGHECVFASELDDELRELYKTNFPDSANHTFGDIRLPEVRRRIPKHDILCAGFPCQPFSKSGQQLGWNDEGRGTLFWNLLEILREHVPKYILLENVGNFEQHDGGNTWRVVRLNLQRLGYQVAGTSHRKSGGPGLISPHHLGFAHTRERFYIVASKEPLLSHPFPDRTTALQQTISDIVETTLSRRELEEVGLTNAQEAYINHWNALVKSLPPESLPSFPLWGDEFWADYDYQDRTPWTSTTKDLRAGLRRHPFASTMSRDELLGSLPSYALEQVKMFPYWKQRFIWQNRCWYERYRSYVSEEWLSTLRTFPFSHRKLEWNVKGGKQDLWDCVLQFRPSGIRAKRYTTSPSLVSMTVSQIPILGPERRFLTVREGMRLQGFSPDEFLMPRTREKAFHALGNAVHTGVVKVIAMKLLGSRPAFTVSAESGLPRQLSFAENVRALDGLKRHPGVNQTRNEVAQVESADQQRHGA